MPKQEKAPNSALVRLDNGIFKVMKVISYASAVCLLVITILSTFDVFSSKLFHSGITNATDIVTYLNIPVVFLSAAYVQLERGHTHIDLIYTHFPKPVQKLIHIIGNLAGIGVSGFCCFRAVVLTMSKIDTVAKSSSAASAFIIWPFAALIALGFLLLSVAFFWSLIRELFLPERQPQLPFEEDGV